MGGRLKAVMILMMMMMMMLVVCNCEAGFDGDRKIRWFSKSTVRVRSEITGNHGLTVHCKSKDDDLGVRTLYWGNHFEWSFSEAIIGHTLFWCYMGWTDSNGKRKEASFEVYNAEKESCGTLAYCILAYTANNHGVMLNDGISGKTSEVVLIDRTRSWSLRASPPQYRRLRVKSFLFNPDQEPILKQALKEPVAFMGGMFAGLLRLDLNEEPLRQWITMVAEASGIAEEDIVANESKQEELAPQQIEIE
ncbi:hypothetical protein Scep_015890 [Stephania cephalantha]|uniref:S-protein homolog n=1 Tax=Stephania cephalantha TaxID=152367 RepID=A0AAP0INI3_9MAGN